MSEKSDLRSYIGCVVRFKKEGATEKFGNLAVNSSYLIKDTMEDYKGKKCIRGHSVEFSDTVGRCIDPDDIEIVSKDPDFDPNHYQTYDDYMDDSFEQGWDVN